jgi:hypothetical protein
VFSAIVLLCCFAAAPTDARIQPVNDSSISAKSTIDTKSAETNVSPAPRTSLPDAPAPKADSQPAAETAAGSEPFLAARAKPVMHGSYESPRQRKIWYSLIVATHGAAAFDAWTTRRALTAGVGTEGDPLMRPFANSNAIYAATQVLPAAMDYLGHRMINSDHPTLRRFWWLPQALAAGGSLGSGIHNYRLVH